VKLDALSVVFSVSCAAYELAGFYSKCGGKRNDYQCAVERFSLMIVDHRSLRLARARLVKKNVRH
jgi:hypothetical protein